MKKLLDKHILNNIPFPERAGMVNTYHCMHCNGIVMYIYADGGRTPDTIPCGKCGNEARSQIKENVLQPSLIWYRPKNIEEIERLAENTLNTLIERQGLKEGVDREEFKKQIISDYIDHYNSGGLFARSIK